METEKETKLYDLYDARDYLVQVRAILEYHRPDYNGILNTLEKVVDSVEEELDKLEDF